MMKNNTTKVFVYGTLKEGYSNHSCLRNSPKITEGWLYGFQMWESYIPYVRKINDPESKVYGEVYEVTQDILINNLDVLEGHPYFYERIFIPDQLGGVWIYLCEKGGRNLVKSGIWGNLNKGQSFD